MLDHVTLRTADYRRSRTFYDAALAPLGLVALHVMDEPDDRSAGYGDQRPFFWIGAASGAGASHGMHIAFAARTRAEVDAFYQAAMAAGGRDNGAPGIREHYHPNYYGAFVFDPDRINVEAVCHQPA